MTVKELKEQIKNCPDDAEVTFKDTYGEYFALELTTTEADEETRFISVDGSFQDYLIPGSIDFEAVDKVNFCEVMDYEECKHPKCKELVSEWDLVECTEHGMIK